MQQMRWIHIAAIGVAVLLGVLSTVNGVAMLLRPEHWYWNTPGVADTGPLNTHFVRDVGSMYLLSGLALIAMLHPRAPRMTLGLAALGWHGSHALVHIGETVTACRPPQTLIADAPAVIAPTLLLILALLFVHKLAKG
jgi:hypothetical protein